MPKHSITLTVTNRPEYLKQTLLALEQVTGIAGWHLYIGLEPGCEACAEICRDISFMPVTILYNEKQLGIRGNPYNVLKHAFAQGSELNIYLEDDIIVSPDTGELALWYKKLIKEDQLIDVRVFFMGLFVSSISSNQADELTVADMFFPWGMVMNRYQWDNLIEPCWWNDAHNYTGKSDWTLSLSHEMSMHKELVVLSPVLSRSTNIGRESGVHSYPERFDLLLNGLVMNREKGPFNYRLNPNARIPVRKVNFREMTVEDNATGYYSVV